jgi:hypothetical protein
MVSTSVDGLGNRRAKSDPNDKVRNIVTRVYRLHDRQSLNQAGNSAPSAATNRLAKVSKGRAGVTKVACKSAKRRKYGAANESARRGLGAGFDHASSD